MGTWYRSHPQASVNPTGLRLKPPVAVYDKGWGEEYSAKRLAVELRGADGHVQPIVVFHPWNTSDFFLKKNHF